MQNDTPSAFYWQIYEFFFGKQFFFQRFDTILTKGLNKYLWWQWPSKLLQKSRGENYERPAAVCIRTFFLRRRNFSKFNIWRSSVSKCLPPEKSGKTWKSQRILKVWKIHGTVREFGEFLWKMGSKKMKTHYESINHTLCVSVGEGGEKKGIFRKFQTQ